MTELDKAASRTPKTKTAEAATGDQAIDKIMQMVDPYRHMDKLDEEAIIAGMSGQTFEHMTYNIPFKSEKGRANCGVPGCWYEKKGFNHTHAVGVGIMGINEVRRVYGGIQCMVVENIQVRRDGRRWWKCTALAVDVLMKNASRRTIWQPITDVAAAKAQDKDMRSDFSPTIAESKAMRNAIKDLLPQTLLIGIAELGRKGKKTFTEDDVRKIIMGFGGASRWNALERLSLQAVNIMDLAIADKPEPSQPSPQNQIDPMGSRSQSEPTTPRPAQPEQKAAPATEPGPPVDDAPPIGDLPEEQPQTVQEQEAEPEQVQEPATEPEPEGEATIDQTDIKNMFALYSNRCIESKWLEDFLHDQFDSMKDIPKSYYGTKIMSEEGSNAISKAILVEQAIALKKEDQLHADIDPAKMALIDLVNLFMARKKSRRKGTKK